LAIAAPIFDVSSFTRVHSNGSVDVTGVDPVNTAEVYALTYLQGTLKHWLVGSQLGGGTVTLDFSAGGEGNLWGLFLSPVLCYAITKDPAGNYSPPSEDCAPALFSADPITITVSDVERSTDGTQVTFILAGMPSATALFFVLWQGENNTPGVASFQEDGSHTISDLSPAKKYTFDGVVLSDAFTVVGLIFFESLYVQPQPPASNFMRRHLKQKAVYWAPTGVDAYGSITLADPVEIWCRWEGSSVIYAGVDGEQPLQVDKVYVSQDLELNGYLMQGTLDNLDSTLKPPYVEGAAPIRNKEVQPSLDAKEVIRVVFLQKKIVSGK